PGAVQRYLLQSLALSAALQVLHGTTAANLFPMRLSQTRLLPKQRTALGLLSNLLASLCLAAQLVALLRRAASSPDYPRQSVRQRGYAPCSGAPKRSRRRAANAKDVRSK